MREHKKHTPPFVARPCLA